jgi:hypothetical protein
MGFIFSSPAKAKPTTSTTGSTISDPYVVTINKNTAMCITTLTFLSARFAYAWASYVMRHIILNDYPVFITDYSFDINNKVITITKKKDCPVKYEPSIVDNLDIATVKKGSIARFTPELIEFTERLFFNKDVSESKKIYDAFINILNKKFPQTGAGFQSKKPQKKYKLYKIRDN